MKLDFKTIILICLFLFGYYQLVLGIFYNKDKSNDETALKERLGTILWHSSGTSNHFNLYCYYPTSKVTDIPRSGEYFLKKVLSIEECKDWLGIIQYQEPVEVSEKDKVISAKSS